MYVMSSLPRHQQSVAGGIFNTVTKLCNTIGLGITTAIFTSMSASTSAKQPSSPTDALTPYLACFWFSCASAGLSICLVPFLRIGTQGGKVGGKGEPDEKGVSVEEKSTDLILGLEETGAGDPVRASTKGES